MMSPKNFKFIQRGTRRLTAYSLIYSVLLMTLAVNSPAQLRKQSKSTDATTVQQPLSEEGQLQIQSLEDEKNSRTPAQQKIDSQLLYAAKMQRHEKITSRVQTLEVNVGAASDGQVTVDVTALVDDELLATLKEMGVEVVSSFPEYHTFRAVANLNQLESVAGFPQVKFIQPKQESFNNRVENPVQNTVSSNANGSLPSVSGSFVNGLFNKTAAQKDAVGRILTNLSELGVGNGGSSTNLIPNGYTGYGVKNAEGVLAHRIYSARGTFNVDGTGIRIGVLSDSVTPTALTASQASGDLPPTCSTPTPPANEQCVNIVPGQGGSTTAGDEGTAMLEVIHDIAPGAQLYFATANTNIASFAANIRTLRTVYNCDIIVDDVGYYAETVFQDGQGPAVISTTNGGVVTQAVNDVTAAGAIYFSSAANSGNKNDGTSGTWEGDFTDGGTLALIPGGNLNDFDPSAAVAQSDVQTVAGGSVPVSIQWSDPLGGSANDYDLFILNNAGTSVVASAVNTQNGTQDPIEQTTVTVAANRRIAILKRTGAANRFLHLNTNRGQLSFSTSGETHGHGAASGGYGVAATPAFSPFNLPPTDQPGPYPGSFTGTAVVEKFSSDGPRRVFFNGDGTAITPGNFTAATGGGTVLQQPSFTAADGQDVTGNIGFSTPFYGTSCAAPTAAAITALLKAASPGITQAQVKTALSTSAIDIETAGVDRDAGNGIVMAYDAIQAAGATGKAFIEFNGYTAFEAGGNGNGLIESGENGSLTVNLRNTGLLSATGITTTLTTTTPNVTVTQGNVNYSNLGPSGSAANGIFGFKLGAGTPPDQVINFALTVNYGGGWNASQVINFTVQTGRQPITTVLDAIAPATNSSFPMAATGTQTTRISRTDVSASTCTNVKAFPATPVAIATANYDAYTFVNPYPYAVCVTVTLTEDKSTTGFMQASLYNGTYDPANIATNYLGDVGSSPLGGYPKSFGVTVAAGATVVAVVNNTAPPTGSGSSYTLQVAGIPLAPPTAAAVSVAGQVTANGKGLAAAKVTISNSNGTTRSVTTNAFGYFNINNVAAGATYVVNVSTKKYTFAPQVISVNDNVSGLNFTAQ